MASNTSSRVKNNWNRKHYKSVQAFLPIPLVEEWEEKLKSEGISKAEFIRKNIENYLQKNS